MRVDQLLQSMILISSLFCIVCGRVLNCFDLQQSGIFAHAISCFTSLGRGLTRKSKSLNINIIISF